MPKFIRTVKLLFILCIAAVIFFAWNALAEVARPDHTNLSESDIKKYGERIYREGILPSGEPVKAIVKGDIEVEGSMFSCQSCHMRGGLGSFEGGVYTPPTNGSTLFQPLKFTYKGIVQEQVPPIRPAYTDKTLAEVLRYGNDPTGKILNDVMPRYELDDRDMAILIAYLKTLSSQFSPGVTEDSISFATVISDDVSQKDREEMTGPLEKYMENKNKLVDYFETSAGWRSRRMAEGMFVNSKEFVKRKLSLSKWILKGPPETWQSQLEEYYRKEPVFALIGGITTGEWGPVHRFCEAYQIPCLYPYADYPVISGTDWYTLYLSKGYYQEGEGAARYLNSQRESIKGARIIQIVRETPKGASLAEGFRKNWIDLGHRPPETIMLKSGETFDKRRLSRLKLSQKNAIVLIWDGEEAVSILEAVASSPYKPRMVFLSHGYVGNRIRNINDRYRDITYITQPYRFTSPSDKKVTVSNMSGVFTVNKPEKPFAPGLDFDPNLMLRVIPKNATKIENQTFSIIQVLNMAFMRLNGHYYRDTFLDVIDCIMDLETPSYERISFGPGQRYSAKGCYIVQLSKGENPEFIKRSNWVSH